MGRTLRFLWTDRARTGRGLWQACHGLVTVALGVAALGVERDARACGGCFPPPTETTVVTDHRMAFAISPTHTVLWDQIQYAGEPSQFAWVLPVRQGTEIELSRDAWIGALDASTQPIIQGPPPQSSSSGVGCGSSVNASFSSDGDRSVQVVEQKVVGPYETVTLRSTDPKALETWLTSHGFAISDAIRPTVDAYVSEGFDFLALRLQPGQGVRAMQPVRVVTAGADLSLPLRMVAAGVGSAVGLTLYVIGEGRYEAENFPNATLDEHKLFWDTAHSRSNYQDLVSALMDSNGGRTWVTEYAKKPDLSGTGSLGAGFLNPTNPGLAAAYFGACRGGEPPPTFGPGYAGSAADAAADANLADAAAEAGAHDAAPPSALDPAADCSAFDDLEVAMEGLHSSTVFVTRMRAHLAPDALKAGDLRLIAAKDQGPVENVHYAPAGKDALRANVGAGLGHRRVGIEVTVFLAALAALGLVRRRRRA